MRYDVIVVGVGSMGSSACYHLSRRGLKVLGLEQFSIVNEEGSHTGQSRLIRKAYFEHSDYVPLLLRSYELWKELEEAARQQLYWDTGIVYFGLPNDPILEGMKISAQKFGIPLVKKLRSDYPEFILPADFECILEPEAGFISPEKTIGALVDLARANGADIRDHQKVIDWEQRGDAVIVTTEEGEFIGDKLVITAGAYVSGLIDLPYSNNVTRQYLGWADTDGFKLGQFPCWVISEPGTDGIYYGFPSVPEFEGPKGMKLGYHRPGDQWKEEMQDGWEDEKSLLNGVLRKYFVDELSVTTSKTCKYTYSPDEHFVLDVLPDTNGRVVIATGFSGHGFKFVPVIGEILADLTKNGDTKHPIGFLRLDRFK